MNTARILISSAALAMVVAGGAQASIEYDLKRYAPNMDTSNLTQKDMNQLHMIIHSGDRQSEKRSKVRNVVRKSNERAAGR